MSNCQSHQDLNIEHKTKHRKVLLWGNTLVSVIIKEKMSFKRRIFMRGCLFKSVLEDKTYFKWLPQQINLSRQRRDCLE